MKNANMPAMPIADSCGLPSMYGSDDIEASGLTKREMMAMHMMAHLMQSDRLFSYEEQAEFAIKAADALLTELERTK